MGDFFFNNSLTADNAQPFKFAYDSESGKYGYKIKEADTDVFVPFSSGVVELPFSLFGFGDGNQAVGTLILNTVHTTKYAIDFTSVNSVQIYASRHASSTSGNLHVAISDEPLSNLSEMQSCEYYKSFTLVAGTTTRPSAFEIDASVLNGKKYINLYSVISGTGNLYMWDIVLN